MSLCLTRQIVKTSILPNKQMKLTLILSSMFLACSIHAQTIKELQTEITALQKQVTAEQAEITTLQSNSVQALVPFVTVDPNPENGVPGPNIVITGANLHVVNGNGPTPWPNGVTPASNGLGNLIIGYDEKPYQTNTVPAQGRSADRIISWSDVTTCSRSPDSAI
jgi:hypothetical protein